MKVTTRDRRQHQQEVQAFLQKHLSSRFWEFSLPGGSGNETYLAHGDEGACFIKLGAQPAICQAMASIRLTPPVLATGSLEDGTSIIVQPYIDGRRPSRRDYRIHLGQFAGAIQKMHNSPEVKRVLPAASSELYSAAGLESLTRIRRRWERCKALVPAVAGFVDESLAQLEEQVNGFEGTGLAASHNDICNANWLISPEEQLYLIDLESMSLDDPALDIGATLWWYYPPGLRTAFLKLVDHGDDRAFEHRMSVRMAMHCLLITLPREQSFDQFDPASFAESLADFRAVLAGEENPQGYED